MNMNINHIAMYVRDLEKMKSFYEKYFSAKSNGGYHNPKTGLKTYFLTFANSECRLEIMAKEGLADAPREFNHAGYIHLAFGAGSKEKVDALTRQLEGDGYQVISGPRTTGDGYYESCFLDPENNQIEVVA